jgi:hypothetical protein
MRFGTSYSNRLAASSGKHVEAKRVTIEGALFYDMPRFNKNIGTDRGGGRGVRCDVRTLWKIHLVIAIGLANLARAVSCS